MTKTLKQILATLAALAVVMTMTFGCGDQEPAEQVEDAVDQATEAVEEAVEE